MGAGIPPRSPALKVWREINRHEFRAEPYSWFAHRMPLAVVTTARRVFSESARSQRLFRQASRCQKYANQPDQGTVWMQDTTSHLRSDIQAFHDRTDATATSAANVMSPPNTIPQFKWRGFRLGWSLVLYIVLAQ